MNLNQYTCLTEVEELIESLEEGLMTDADLTKKDRELMSAQIEALEVVRDRYLKRIKGE